MNPALEAECRARATADRRPIADPPIPATDAPRTFGLTLTALHDRLWAARSIAVVRRGQSLPPSDALAFLLLERDQLVRFDPRSLIRRLRGRQARVIELALPADQCSTSAEQLGTSDIGEFVSVHRTYDPPRQSCDVVHLTNDAVIARQWTAAADSDEAARLLRASVELYAYVSVSIDGMMFSSRNASQRTQYEAELLRDDIDPGSIVPSVRCVRPGVWAHESAVIETGVRFVGPAWVGAGAHLSTGALVIGPHIICDCTTIDEPPRLAVAAAPGSFNFIKCCGHRFRVSPRRLFDITFSVVVLMMAAPLLGMIAVAILLDDGWPILYRHRRQTIGGRDFDCCKFRTMRTNADAMKASLQAQNICDGPQFFIRDDPRETRVGRWLRRTHLDELPQFFNVLAGHMSIVGPRPSPEVENRYCPAWRRARLSVKPGITGLWQIRRTRQPLADFQEWIRYDTQYVRRRSWWMDLRILIGTLRNMLPGRRRNRSRISFIAAPQPHRRRQRDAGGLDAQDRRPQ